MAMMFGGSPVQTPSIDAVLAGMGLAGATPAGSPDPSAVLAGLGIRPAAANLSAAPQTQGAQPSGLDLSSLMSQSAPQQAQPDPSQAAAPTAAGVAANASASLPPNLSLGNRNPIGDLLDNIFLGGAIQNVRSSERDRALQDVQTQRNLQAYGALQQQIANLPDGPEKSYAQSDPLGWQKIQAARLTPDDLKEGETRVLGNGQMIFAPHYGFDTASGTPYTQAGTNTVFSPALGGDLKVDPGSGALVSSRTGPTGTYLPQFHSAPVTDNAGYTAPNGANLAPGLGGGSAPTGGAQGAAQNAAPADAYSAAVVKLESGGNPNARNGSSIGILQFHPSTFKQFNPTGDINNPADQQVALQNETAHNTQVLQGAGLQATPQNLYLLHQQGTSGGLALLQNPDKNAVQTLVDGGFYPNARVARRAITRNYGTADMTGGQFAGLWGGKLSRALRQTGGAAAVTAGPAQSAPQGGGQFPSGWQGKGYTVDPTTGVVTSPEGQPTAGPNMISPKDIRDKAYGDEFHEGTTAVQSYNSLANLARQNPNGIRGYAIKDLFARTSNPKGAVRVNTIDALNQAPGLNQQLRGKILNLNDQGNLTPQLVQQYLDSALPFAQAAWHAQDNINQANIAYAKRHNINPADVTADIGPMPKRVNLSQPQFSQADLATEMRRRGLLK